MRHSGIFKAGVQRSEIIDEGFSAGATMSGTDGEGGMETTEGEDNSDRDESLGEKAARTAAKGKGKVRFSEIEPG